MPDHRPLALACPELATAARLHTSGCGHSPHASALQSVCGHVLSCCKTCIRWAAPHAPSHSTALQGGDVQPVEESKATATNGSAPAAKPLPVKIIQALLPLLLVVLAFAVKMYADAPAKST